MRDPQIIYPIARVAWQCLALTTILGCILINRHLTAFLGPQYMTLFKLVPSCHISFTRIKKTIA